ncbi:hypothetical protein ACFWIB_04390 [Streptomyces sp. NPDC127051]|uniref:hypothetical protein n=1 Tax=Streptomyces sp. NPDC127051 TaxID=3347119 RepID=UPI00364624E1
MSTPAGIAGRCAKAYRLAKGGASTQEIAEELGVSTDTVLRDKKRFPTAAAARAHLLAHHAAQAEAAVRQAVTAAQAVTEARPGYTIVDDETAGRWCSELRAAAEQLAAAASAFADYYPSVTR